MDLFASVPMPATATSARMFCSGRMATTVLAGKVGCGYRLQRSGGEHLDQKGCSNAGGRQPAANLGSLQVLHGSHSDFAANYVGAVFRLELLHHAFSVQSVVLEEA